MWQVSLSGKLSHLFAQPASIKRFKLDDMLKDFSIAIGAESGVLWVLDTKKTVLQLQEEFQQTITSSSTAIFSPKAVAPKPVLSMTSAVTSLLTTGARSKATENESIAIIDQCCL